MLIKQPRSFLNRAVKVMQPVYMMPFEFGSKHLDYIVEQIDAGNFVLPENAMVLYYPFLMNDRHLYVCELDFSRAKNNSLEHVSVAIYHMSYEEADNPMCFVNDLKWGELPDASALIEGLQRKDCYTKEEMLKITPRILVTRVKPLADYTISQIHIMMDYLN